VCRDQRNVHSSIEPASPGVGIAGAVAVTPSTDAQPSQGTGHGQDLRAIEGA